MDRCWLEAGVVEKRLKAYDRGMNALSDFLALQDRGTED
jgi:hypothetical protein